MSNAVKGVFMSEYISKAILFLGEYAECDMQEVDENSYLISDMGLNSLQLVEIVNDAELEFDIVIEDDELESIQTVGDIARLLEAKGA